MNDLAWSIIKGIAIATTLSMAATASASDKSTTVLLATGHKQCSDFSVDSIQLEGKALAQGKAHGERHSALYTIKDGTTLSFADATIPVDYALLRSEKTVAVLMYPAGGVTSDANMTVALDGKDRPITSFSLCHGKGNNPPAPKILQSCNAIKTLGEVGISCPKGHRTLVCGIELDEAFFGLKNGGNTCCVCGAEDRSAGPAAYRQCDPDLPAGEKGACPKATKAKAPAEVPTLLELNNDPYYCVTVGGTRTCFAY